jgi:6-phosphogluconolactonase
VQVEVLPDAKAVARAAAKFVAEQARQAIAARGRFVVAFSGGSTPWQMLCDLAEESVAWQNVFVAQVDERIAPVGDPDRNLTHLRESLLSHAALPEEQLCAMPVEADDPAAAAASYEQRLQAIAGSPAVLDLVHLGLGADGHTASLVPGDSVLDVQNRDVALSGIYQGRRRMTLTYPILNRARQILWLVTGDSKVEMLARLRSADPAIPAGRISQQHALLLADRAAAPGE